MSDDKRKMANQAIMTLEDAAWDGSYEEAWEQACEDLEAVPKAELRELVDEFRRPEGDHDAYREVSHYPERGRIEYINLTLDYVADELEKRLNE